MFLHTWHPQPLIATLGSLQLHWYGLFLALAALIGNGVVIFFGKRYRLDTNKLFDLTLIVLISGFFGARLYHVLNEWTYYQAHITEIWKVWNGGLALHGGLLAGGVMLVVMAKRWKMNGWLLADIVAPAFALAQAIGRWGNYFNQELFGKPTGRAWGIPIDMINRQPPYFSQDFFHPTFLYESLGLLIIAAFLSWLHCRRWKKAIVTEKFHYGNISLTYIVLASILRLAIESLRIDRTPIIGGLRLPIIVTSLLIVGALLILFIRYRRAHAHTSAT